MGVIGTLVLAAGAAAPSTVAVAVGVALLGSEYALHLVLDEPPADARAAVVAAALLACAELAFWSAELRGEVTREPGRQARRLGYELALVLGALLLGALVLAAADLGRVGGAGIEVVGGAAAVGLLTLALAALRPH